MTCHDLCTFHNGNKNRFIGADAGYMLKWEIEDGLPRGCSVFKNKKGEYMTNEEFRYNVITNTKTLRHLNISDPPDSCVKMVRSSGVPGRI